MGGPRMSVDVALNYFGKPWQTLAAVWSLLLHSSAHVGRIFVTRELDQPVKYAPAFEELLLEYGPAMPGDHEVVVLRPSVGFGTWFADLDRARAEAEYRWGLRYQAAIEASEARYVFICHNDVLFTGDILGPMLARAEDEGLAGVGHVGQCWNCPAREALSCSPHDPVRLTHAEALALYAEHPGPRDYALRFVPDSPRKRALPECRLNEFAALLDLDVYRREVLPAGDVTPIGAYNGGVDLGSAWYREMVERGHAIGHFDIFAYARHGWLPERAGGGHAALSDDSLYVAEEAAAEEWCRLAAGQAQAS